MLFICVAPWAGCKKSGVPNDAELRRSIRQADVRFWKQYLQQGDPNRRIETAWGERENAPLLHLACSEGREDLVELFIASGVLTNATDSQGRSALMWVADRRGEQSNVKTQSNILNRLLRAGTDVNLSDFDGQTALMFASAGGQIGVMELLLNSGAKVNVQDRTGMSALHLAKNAQTAGLLLRNGADLRLTNNAGETALEMAVRRNNEPLANFLKAESKRLGTIKEP